MVRDVGTVGQGRHVAHRFVIVSVGMGNIERDGAAKIRWFGYDSRVKGTGMAGDTYLLGDAYLGLPRDIMFRV